MATYEDRREVAVTKMLDAIERGVLTPREALLHCYDVAYVDGEKHVAGLVGTA